ncbi:hypothetical protein E9229_003227 [Paeniglutamicibacter cryotolerans]|uniref:Uncharacterized protein n=1 Tax=Paeniglutamicibacter cryotolerans TaxID=670079 RepID=A0A839QMI9_9MICC|nr:hypothetical protein [Paeniglutamicibacter cryotolerans]
MPLVHELVVFELLAKVSSDPVPGQGAGASANLMLPRRRK